jgi:D-lactate dehydrogenase
MQMGDYRLDHLVFDGKKCGTGKIGGAFAKIMHGFGCQILACDPEERVNQNRYNLHHIRRGL